MNILLKKFAGAALLSATALLLAGCGGTTYWICNSSGQPADFNEGTTVQTGKVFKAEDKTFGSDWPVEVTGKNADGTDLSKSVEDPGWYVWNGTAFEKKSKTEVEAACSSEQPEPEDPEKKAPEADYSKSPPATKPVVKTGVSTAGCTAGVIHETVCRALTNPSQATPIVTFTALHYIYDANCPAQSQVSVTAGPDQGNDICTDTVEKCTSLVLWHKAEEKKRQSGSCGTTAVN